ncbi:MAG: ACP phosphodiesterase [Rikenellaceae bacterium]|nr:ACP phosphodiesterase [Rikenellaceae bacterium]
MNYLAHIFLSGEDREVQLGNFIADAVKGSTYKDYPEKICIGILLHREIDSFTDQHTIVKELNDSMRPHFGRYSGILLDIYFDYLLASRFSKYSGIPLRKFTKKFYWTILWNHLYLPRRFKRFMWHFILTDRLSRYASINGIRESLSIMVKYRHLNISVDEAVDYLVINEDMLRSKFNSFFEELRKFIKSHPCYGIFLF